jgi:C4-dicarboxylate transporter/malic acid transport protein
MKRLRRVIDMAGPHWFTSVMGTGILGVDLIAAPIANRMCFVAGAAVWTLAAVELAVVVALLALRAALAPAGLAATLRDPAVAQLWGAPPMAAFTVAVGLMRIAAPHGCGEFAIGLAQVLWVAGALGGLLTAFYVPYLMMTELQIDSDNALATWLLPVVPPVVAAVPAALLLPTFPVALQSSILAFAYANLGVGVALAALIVAVFFSRLLFAKLPAGALAPSMWIVIGPLGQSIAAAFALGTSAAVVWPAVGSGLETTALAYGLLVWGFGMYWLALALVTTVSAMRSGMPFTLGWWSFTFPVGTLTAGTDALYGDTGAALFGISAVALLVLLAAAWAIVAAKTARSAIHALVAPSAAAGEASRGAAAAAR